jgi:hypothetical protein
MNAVIVHDLFHLLDEVLPHGALLDRDVYGAHDSTLGKLPDMEVMNGLNAGQDEKVLPQGAQRNLTAQQAQ